MSDFLQRLRDAQSKSKPAGEYTLAGSGFVAYLRRLTLGEKLKFDALARDKDRPAVERQADMLAIVLCDEENRPVFASGADVMTLELGGDADELITAALRANGIGDEKKAPPPSPTTS